MEIIDYLLARKKAGGGSDVTIEQLNATENGTYSEEGIAYSPVVVNVPAPENSYQLKDVPSGAVSTIDDGTALPMSSLKVGIEPVQEGSGDPSPDNIRPISGWTAANVTRTGKNLFDESILLECSGWTVSDGVYSGTSGYIHDKYSNGVPNLAFKPNTQYTFSFTYGQDGPAGNALVVIIRYTDNTIAPKYCTLDSVGFNSVTSTEGKSIAKLELSYGSNRTIHLSNMQLEEGSTATTYEPYNGTTYTIQFKDGDNPLTVYGGTLDVVNGELVVDRVKRTLSANDTFVKLGSTSVYFDTWLDIIKPTEPQLGFLKCSHYKEELQSSAANRYIAKPVNNRAIIFKDSIHATSVDNFKTYIAEQISNNTPIEVVYKLDNSVTYQLTPTQVRTLVGNNNIWADTGNIIEGKYFKSLS